jgi:hypothetical protein
LLPDGFPDLVKLAIKDWDWDLLPEKDDDIWEALLYTIFLGATVRTAQANYIKEVLGDVLEFKAANAVHNFTWSKKALKITDSELRSIHGTPGESLKSAILQIAIKEIQSLDLSRTIDTALNFFAKYSINVPKIKALQDDLAGSLNVVDYAAHEIYNVRYIKGVLWLYSCGIAKDIVPPNAHVTRFLDECGYPQFAWSRNMPEDWQIFTIACAKMREVAKQVETELSQRITPKQAQAAVWYLQTCRGLLPRNTKRKLTPSLLIDFLNSQKWAIKKLNSKLNDIEELESVTNDLKGFLG